MTSEVAPKAPRSTVRTWLDVVATIAMIAASAGILWSVATKRTETPQDLPLPREPVSLEGVATKGSPQAKVVLIEYSDFQCPFCARLAIDTLPEIVRTYVDTGKVLLAFRHVPLNIHPFARQAGEAAECAGKQGKFWEMHDALFRNQTQLDEPSLHVRAKELAIDSERFATCLANEAPAIVRQHEAHALELGIASTPQMLIGVLEPDGRVRIQRRLSGAQPPSSISQVLDEVIR